MLPATGKEGAGRHVHNAQPAQLGGKACTAWGQSMHSIGVVHSRSAAQSTSGAQHENSACTAQGLNVLSMHSTGMRTEVWSHCIQVTSWFVSAAASSLRMPHDRPHTSCPALPASQECKIVLQFGVIHTSQQMMFQVQHGRWLCGMVMAEYSTTGQTGREVLKV